MTLSATTHRPDPAGRARAIAEPVPASVWERFLAHYPEYRTTGILDALRKDEYPLLDEQGHVYLDYTGGGLYSHVQVARHLSLLRSEVLGNPHSINPTSRRATELVERCRQHVLRFFNAKPEEYTVIFTANASAALKLVGESYPFKQGDRFLLTFDNHNSVNGIREYDRARGAETRYVPMLPPDLRIDETVLARELEQARPGGNNLFAFPAQSNFSGVQHPLSWIEQAQGHGWDVLLDVAAFVPTNRLDLSRFKPDYVALSFYKMFGYPTGVGALLARGPALAKLHRPWFAGGTITVASVQADRFCMAPGYEAFEDGTVNYTGLPAVDIGLGFIESIGLERIHTRVRCLAGWLIKRLLELRHANGAALVRIYGPVTTEARGGTVALNFYDPAGKLIDHHAIEERAARRNISLRTGCFCNPGAGEMALGISKEALAGCFDQCGERMTFDDYATCVNADSTGAVRLSVGLVSTVEDVETFIAFARGLLIAA